MGQYWKFDNQAVDINPRVIAYVRDTKPKRKLLEIAVPGRVDPGSWQDYAWRWALCHLLANNPNYADRFKPLAIALMKRRQGVTFEAIYGPTAQQLSFEYAIYEVVSSLAALDTPPKSGAETDSGKNGSACPGRGEI